MMDGLVPLHRMAPRLTQNIVVRLILYYGLLFGLWWGLWSVAPQDLRGSLNDLLGPVLGAGAGGGTSVGEIFSGRRDAVAAAPASGGGPHTVGLIATFVCLVAVVLSIPIALVYMHTRQKKGYSQSVVHTIVLLPAVVAAVAVLVRNNVALAFSLAGIVAAVRFRTSLEDSRDAVFVFAVSALGLAAGVHVEFASILSVLFSGVALALWHTDFGRTPPDLEGIRAEQHMQRALAIANRTSQFVARVDREILDSLAPQQLDALADRVRRRRAQTGEQDGFDGTIHVRLADDARRPDVEKLLAERAKRWQLLRTESEDGVAVASYGVKVRKGVKVSDLATLIEHNCEPFVLSVQSEES